MSDDTPTQRFDQPANSAGDAPEEEKKRRNLVPLFAIIGAILLIAVIVLGALLITRGSGTPTAAGTDSPAPSSTSASTPVPTPTVTVTVTPSAAPVAPAAPEKPVGNNVLISQYTISPTTVNCSSGAPAGSTNLNITWKSINGQTAYFGVGNPDAKTDGMGWMLPASGTQHNFPAGNDPYTYQCGDAQELFSITIDGTNSSEQSLSITVKRQ